MNAKFTAALSHLMSATRKRKQPPDQPCLVDMRGGICASTDKFHREFYGPLSAADRKIGKSCECGRIHICGGCWKRSKITPDEGGDGWSAYDIEECEKCEGWFCSKCPTDVVEVEYCIPDDVKGNDRIFWRPHRGATPCLRAANGPPSTWSEDRCPFGHYTFTACTRCKN